MVLIVVMLLICIIPKTFSYKTISNFQKISTVVRKSSTNLNQEVIYGGLHHCGVIVADVIKSKAYYEEIFQFEDESYLRPSTLPYPGAFLKCGPNQIHLMQLPNFDPTENRPTHAGRDRHIALTVNNIDILKTRLESKGIPYTFSQSGRRALFCRDLDGNGFEFMENPELK